MKTVHLHPLDAWLGLHCAATIPGTVNQDSRLDFVAGCRTGRRAAGQDTDNFRLGFPDASQEVFVQGALGLQDEIATLHRYAYPPAP